jgi:thiamine-monophosphate kinase
MAGALGGNGSGLGDDCALLPEGAGTVAISTDVSVEGVHFQLDWLTLREVGWRATAAALSDLAADAAEPLAVLSAVTAPAGAGERELAELAAGVGAAAAAAGAAVVGGDLSAGPAWSVAITVVGRVERPVTRSGARPGDGVWVTGALGAARSALEAWRRGDAPSEAARRAFARPEPRVAAARWLAAHDARAMLDLSDGLAGDAPHLAAASGVAIDLTLDTVPVAADTIAEARRLGVPVQQFAAEGGEDYELLVALPDDFSAGDVREFERAAEIALTRVGSVRRGRGVRARLAGRPITLRGYSHFR